MARKIILLPAIRGLAGAYLTIKITARVPMGQVRHSLTGRHGPRRLFQSKDRRSLRQLPHKSAIIISCRARNRHAVRLSKLDSSPALSERAPVRRLPGAMRPVITST